MRIIELDFNISERQIQEIEKINEKLNADYCEVFGWGIKFTWEDEYGREYLSIYNDGSCYSSYKGIGQGCFETEDEFVASSVEEALQSYC